MILAPSIESYQSRLPIHVAIIMDGNRRWAKARGLPNINGHKKGAEAVKVATETCIELGVKYLTIYAFSSENWKRPNDEVLYLMNLLQRYISKELNEINEKGIKLKFIGNLKGLSSRVQKTLANAEKKTVNNQLLTLTVAVNYGSKQEIIKAAQKLATDATAGIINPNNISESEFEEYLHTFGTPNPDLLIRTSGEQRLSNFLLWQSAYAELAFVETLWPDFSKNCLVNIITEYQKRERRYGGAG